jgi:predicted nuclease of predicted toxin-antitoxin system
MFPVVVDMNLSPDWVAELTRAGFVAVHWSEIGPANTTDDEIADWAISHGHVVLTQDLDFGTALALSRRAGPSVVQLRSLAVRTEQAAVRVIAAIHRYAEELEAGAILVIEEERSRVRLLPMMP